MKGQKGYLLSLTLNNIKKSNINDSLKKVGVDHIWNTHKQKVDGEYYIILGLYTQSLDKEISSRLRNMVHRLTRDGFINPTIKRGSERVNLMTSIDPNYTNVGYPLTLLNQQDFLYLMCMDDITRAGKLTYKVLEEREPFNQFESLLFHN
jgi:hypothetical protein